MQATIDTNPRPIRMRAIVQRRYGPPDQLRLEEVDLPTVTDEQALVRVRATSVNAGDWRQVVGKPYAARKMMGGLRAPGEKRIGGDVAGIVEAVGRDVTHVKPGDEVYGIRSGAFAEYVAAKAVVPKPANLTLEKAAAVPIAAVTALQALHKHGGLQPGQHVVVNGAGGGVGTFAVQIAKALGAEVTAVTSTRNVELVRGLGADHVIDYTREDFTRGGRRYDLLVELGGTPSLRACRRALRRDGLLVIVGAGKGDWVGPFTRFIAGSLRRRLLKQRIVGFIAAVERDDLLFIKELIEAGKVTPVIDRTYPLEQLAEAMRYVETGTARGKVVVTVP